MSDAINWRRIQGLRLAPLAMSIARRHNVAFGDVYTPLVLAIVELARSNPVFLDQTDSYILTGARWRVLDQLRKTRQVQVVKGIEVERLPAPGTDPESAAPHPCLADVEAALDTLDDDLRAVTSAMLADPERFLAGGHNGNVNKTALGGEFGRSAWWARERLGRLRCALASINGVSTVYENQPLLVAGSEGVAS